MIYTPMTKAALKLCFEAHKDQVDKSGIPYVFHPFFVAEYMSEEAEVCVALLHDVMEDTDLTADDIRAAGMSEEVVEALLLMTHDPDEPYDDYIERLSSNPIARQVKEMDLVHNMELDRLDEVTERDVERWEKYKRALAFLNGLDSKHPSRHPSADRAGGFGTLGFAPENPASFFGENEDARIDDDGFLHGLLPFDALEGGFMVFPSLVFEGCIQVHLAQCWPEFAAALEADLATGADDSDGCVEHSLRDKALSLLADPPSRVPFEGGAVAIPRAVMEEAGIDCGQEVVVVGNEGYFEVFSKTGYEQMAQETDLSDAIFGE